MEDMHGTLSGMPIGLSCTDSTIIVFLQPGEILRGHGDESDVGLHDTPLRREVRGGGRASRERSKRAELPSPQGCAGAVP